MLHASIRANALAGWHAFFPSGAGGFVPPVDQAMPATAPMPPAGRMPLQDFVRFSEGVVASSGNVAVPWLVGTHYDLAELGRVGAAINGARNVGIALRRLVDYFALLQDCTDVRLECDTQSATVSYRILSPDIWPRHQDAMFTLGIVAQIIRRGRGSGWDKIEFAFEADRNDMRADLSRVLGAPCTFEADANQLRFPVGFLDLSLEATPDPAAMRDLNREVVTRLRSLPIVHRMAHLVYRDLNLLNVDQGRLAREIGMSDRTMRRKLADAGSSYQQVLDECRMRQSIFELQTRPDLSIAQIALRLGYAEHSAFTRAFTRWSGLSPQAYRAQLGACQAGASQ
jgi:AraC-like DNA-binding protein